MIRYALACGRGHSFEAWFRSSGDFESEQGAGRLTCPVCGSADVRKSIMAPAVGRATMAPDDEAPAPAPGPGASPGLPDRTAFINGLAELRRRATEGSDYVGPAFAEEARRIHYGEAPKRGIYGEATSEEADELLEEGVEVWPLPSLPEDGH